MKKRILYYTFIACVMTSYAQETQHPWLKQWHPVTQEDITTHTEHVKNTLTDTSKNITDLLKEQAEARIPKAHIFNKKLKMILDANTIKLIQNAQKFEDEIRSEAQNTFDYKVNMKINPYMLPQPPSSHATKAIRINRKVFSNYHTRKIH